MVCRRLRVDPSGSLLCLDRRDGESECSRGRESVALKYADGVRTAALVMAQLLLALAPLSAQSWKDHMTVPTGKPDGYVQGAFENISCGYDGEHTCSVGFKKADGTKHWLYLLPYGPLYVNGVSIRCHGFPPGFPHECDQLPRNVLRDKTQIRLPYWWFVTADGFRFAYTDQFSTVK